MSIGGGVNLPGSRIGRVAAADAILTAALLGLCVVFAFTYDVFPAAGGGLVPVFLLGSVLLTLVAGLDVLGGRRIMATREQSPGRQSTASTASSAVAGLLLLMLGTLVTLLGFTGVYPEHRTAFASWTVTVVGFLLLAALSTQTLLVVLTLLLRRTPPNRQVGLSS